MCQCSGIALASSVQLQKSRRKERKNKRAITCDIIITMGLFLRRLTSESHTQLYVDTLY